MMNFKESTALVHIDTLRDRFYIAPIVEKTGIMYQDGNVYQCGLSAETHDIYSHVDNLGEPMDIHMGFRVPGKPVLIASLQNNLKK